MFCSICGPIWKHLLFLSKLWITFSFRDHFKQNKVANHELDTNLALIKWETKKNEENPQNIEILFSIFFQMLTFHPVEGAQHQLNKNWWTRHKWPYLMNTWDPKYQNLYPQRAKLLCSLYREIPKSLIKNVQFCVSMSKIIHWLYQSAVYDNT